MEGKGRSRRRSPHQQWKRRLSSVLAIVLTAVMVLNMPLSIDGLGLHVSNAFASASNADRMDSVWATASNAKYKQGESQDVDIYVIADDNGAVPGNTSSMTLYLKNNTNQMITEGVLTFKGSHIQKEDGVFQDIGAGDEASQVIVSGPGQDAGTAPESGAAADDGAAANDGAPQAADVSGNDAAQGTGLAQDTVTSGEGLLYEESFDADEAGEDSDFAEDFEGDEEDSEEEETWKLTGIDLQPGEMHEVSFAFYTDEDVKSTKAHVKFSFAGEDEEGERVSSDTQFYYSIGLPHVNISLEDGMQIESNVNNDMEIWMTEPDWVDEDLEERIEDQEEKEAEKEQEEDADNSGSSDTASDSNASKSDADRADTASDSQADREEKPSVIRDEEKIDKYTDEAMTISESRVSYTVEIFGAEYDLHARKADEVEDIGWISCVYKIAKETQPGIYYGKVTAAGRWNNKKFTSEQGFLFEVTGEWDGNYTAKSENVTVHAHAEDGVLPKNVTLKVTELEAVGAEYNKAKEAMDGTDIQFDGIKALDIRFENQNGEEVEPEGEVQISIEMKEGALPAGATLDTVEVHHLKEVDDETIEVETVADAAGLTDGTVKSGEAVQEELEEIAADAEEETEVSADVYTQAAIPAAAAAPVTLDAVAEVDKDTVAVAEFSVESFSSFTITWGNEYWAPKLELQRITEDGNGIGEDDGYEVNGNFREWINLENLANNDASIYGYDFVKAVIVDDDEKASEAANKGTPIKSIYYAGSWRYRTGDRGSGEELDDQDVYLIYEKKDTSPIKVYVYVAGTGLSDECLDLLGIDRNTLDANGYFPAGEIYLDPSYFEGKSDYAINTPGQPLINSFTDWEALLKALGDMNTSTLVDQRNWSYSGATSSGKNDYSVNQGNHVGDYLDQARGDIGYTWGSQHTALFRWHTDPSQRGNAHYGFADQNVKYHLDLMFTTNTIQFVLGNNDIDDPDAYDGLLVDWRTYITGSEIQPPRDLNIPEGYYFDGYYEDENFTKPWDRIGEPLWEDEVVYIKLSKNPVLALTITKEVVGDADVEDKEYSFIISTKSPEVSGKSYGTSQSSGVTFSETPDEMGMYTAEVTMTVSSQTGVDGSVIIYSLPTGVTYTIIENMESAGIDGYDCEVLYMVNGVEGNTVVTGAGSTASTSARVDVTNTYKPSYKTLTIKKNVTGNMGDKEQEFDFALTLKKDGASYTADIKTATGGTLSAENGEYPFALKDSESIVLSIPVGVEYTIEEKDLDYKPSYQIDEKGKYTQGNKVEGVLDHDTIVGFKNHREMVSPTGFFTDNLPYMMMLIISNIGTVGFLYPVAWKKRRKSGKK